MLQWFVHRQSAYFVFPPGNQDHFVRRMMCTPESVSTASLISPTWRAKVASSKGFCICPLPNMPKSPPFLAELQSLNLLARSSKVASLLTIWLLYPARMPSASSLDRVMLSSRQELGLLLSLCF